MDVISPNEGRVLILVPVLNEESTIVRCLQSVISQSHTNWILVCQDNASDDATFSQVTSMARHDPRIIIHRLEQRVPAGDNWNLLAIKSLLMYKSGYVCWLAGDDYWSEADYLSQLIAELRSTSAAIASPLFQRVSPSNELIQSSFLLELNGCSKTQRTISLLRPVRGGLLVIYALYKRKNFEEILYKGGALSNYTGSDFWWAYASILQGRVDNVPNTYYFKTSLSYDKHNLYPGHSNAAEQVIDSKGNLRRIIWNWKLYASLFYKMVYLERWRFKLLRDGTLLIVIPGIFALTLFRIILFPLNGITYRIKRARKKRYSF